MFVNQSVARLHDILMFFASSAAQVWAAFLIFIVLLLRDLASQKRSMTKEIWLEARLLWKDLIPDLEQHVRTGSAQTADWHLDPEILERANTHLDSFQSLLDAISVHQIVRELGKDQPGSPLTPLHYHRNLNCAEWQRVFDTLNQDLHEISKELAPPLRSLRLGLFATAANLFVLALPSYLTETPINIHHLLACLLILNILIGWIFYLQLKRSLKVVG